MVHAKAGVASFGLLSVVFSIEFFANSSLLISKRIQSNIIIIAFVSSLLGKNIYKVWIE